MSAIVVRLDCPNYQKMGWCRLKNRIVEAFDPACFEAAYIKKEVKRCQKPKPTREATPAEKIVVRETLTDKQMVDLLREHGWTVTCEKNEKVKL